MFVRPLRKIRLKKKPLRKKVFSSANTKGLIVSRQTKRNHSSNETPKEKKRFSCSNNKYLFFSASAFLLSGWFFLSQTEDENKKNTEDKFLKQLSQHDLRLTKILNSAFSLYVEGNPREAIYDLSKYLKDFPELKDLFIAFEHENFETLKTLSEDLLLRKLNLNDIYHIIKSDILFILERNEPAITLLKEIEKNSQHTPLKLLAKLKLAENDPHLSQEQKQKITQSLRESIKSTNFCENVSDTKLSLNIFLKKYLGLIKENGGITLKDYFNLPQSNNNFVIIRIWLKEGDFGHVSLETGKNYISFWPEKKNYSQTCVPGVWKKLEDDFKSYNKLPDYKIKLNTIDSLKIDELHTEMKKDNLRWSLLPLTEKHHHCAIMAYYLLYEGGITNYISALLTYQVERGLQYLDNNFGPLGSITVNLIQASVEAFSLMKSIASYPWYLSAILPIWTIPGWVLVNSPSLFMKGTNHLWHNPQYLMFVAFLAKHLEMDNLAQKKNNEPLNNTIDSPKKSLGR